MMNRFEALAQLLAGLKGAPASVLWALSLAGRPLSRRELVLLTGFSEKPVRRAVGMLLEQGIIEHEGPRVVALVAGWAERRRDWGPGTGDRGSGAGGRGPEAVESLELKGDMIGKPSTPGTASEITDAFKATPAVGESAMVTGESAANRANRTAGGRSGEFGGQNFRNSGHLGDPDNVVVESDPDLDLADQQQQLAPEAKKLGRLLRRLGINGRAYERLAGRADLAGRPALVLGWWWYYRAQEGVRNPAGAAIARLDSQEEPPEMYLGLAQVWPLLPAGVTQELEAMFLRNWSAGQMATALRPANPGLTAGVIRAYMALYMAAPEELATPQELAAPQELADGEELAL